MGSPRPARCPARYSARWKAPAATILAVASFVAFGCAHQTDKAAKAPAVDAQDEAARVSRDNAALRRRVQMLEDRVLNLEQNGAVAQAGPSAVETYGPGGRDLPVVRLQADPPHADPSVSARTWQSTTAAGAAHAEPRAAAPQAMRRSTTIGTQPSPLAVDPEEELGGFAGAPVGDSGAAGSSYRLVGSRLAELSKSERKPDAEPQSRPRTKASRKARRNAVLARYEQAMATLKAGRADLAQAEFGSIADEYPRHEYADNALYWKGESAYDQRHYADALAAFTQVVERYGGGNKAPDALLKIGLCYNNLGDAANARDVLTELIAAYPGARASGIARVKLAELGTGSSVTSAEGN